MKKWVYILLPIAALFIFAILCDVLIYGTMVYLGIELGDIAIDYLFFICYSLSLLPILFYLYLQHNREGGARHFVPSFGPIKSGTVFKSIILGASLFMFNYGFMGFESAYVPDLSYVTKTINKGGFMFLAVSSIGGVIFIPIVEEIIYRGFVYNIAKQCFLFPWVNLIPSIAFALGHPDKVLPMLIFALVLTAFLKRTKSLYYVIIAHIINNLLSITIPYVGSPIVYALCIVFGFTSIFLLIRSLRVEDDRGGYYISL